MAACSPSSPGTARRGAQEPRVTVAVGDASGTDGPDAAALAASVGLDAFPWQRSVLDDWCSRDAHDRPAFATNPSMEYVLDAGFTETESWNSDLDGLARERLG